MYWTGGAQEATGSDGELKLAEKGEGGRITVLNSRCV